MRGVRCLLVLLLSGCADPEPTVLFVEVTEGRIATDGGASRGVAWGDFDEDGDPDLVVTNTSGQWNALYRNHGDGTFGKATAPPLDLVARAAGRSEGASWVDHDGDGDLDLFITNRGPEPNLLFQNVGTEGFERIEGHALTAAGISSTMACWADIEGDGDLDVFLASYRESQPNRVFRNLGEGSFEEVEDSRLRTGSGEARACGWADLTGDGLPELYVAKAQAANLLFRNRGDWEFEQETLGHHVTHAVYSYGLSWADFDDDGDLDLFVANFDAANGLYRNDEGQLRPVTEGRIATDEDGASKGHAWGDYDLDGDLDLFVASGTYGPDMRNALYLNSGDGSFLRAESTGVLAHADTSAGLAWADYDLDGDLDVFVANWGGSDQVNRFYRNETSGKSWLGVRLRSSGPNSRGVGARARVVAGGQTQYRWMWPTTGYASQNDDVLHFGLGSLSEVDSLVIDWPSGVTDVHVGLRADRYVTAIERGDLR